VPRAPTGTLIPPGADGFYRGKVTKKEPKGPPTRPTYSLGTADRALAKRKLAQLAARAARGESLDDFEEVGGRSESVRAYALGWIDKRKAQKIGMAQKELRNLEIHVFPAIGAMAVGDVRAVHVRSVLEEVVGKGRGRNTVGHIRALLHRLFRSAVEDQLAEHNPVADARSPKVRETKKERVILTDDEFVRFVSDPGDDLEIRMLSLVARCEGGMRTGDLNAWDWSMIDRVHFAECFVPRMKTAKPQRLDIPEPLSPFVRAWWERAGKPEVGPVFPATKGKRAGKARSPNGLSFAKRLRRELFKSKVWRMPPVTVPKTSPGTRTDRGKKAKGTMLAPNPADPLYFDTAVTRKVDFHSFRRAFNTALAEAGVNVQHAMHLASHSDPKVHARYVMNTAAMRAIPDAALPRLPAPGNVPAQDVSTDPANVTAEIINDYRAEGGNRTPDLARMKRPL
jgi:integrase